MPDEYGMLASNDRWLTPQSLSYSWGDEHSALRHRDAAHLLAAQFNPQREALFLRRLHNCWLHCDFPSECRTMAVQARKEGRPVGREAKAVDEWYLTNQRRKMRRAEDSSRDSGAGKRMLAPSLGSYRQSGQRMSAEDSSGDDDEDDDGFSCSSSSEDDSKSSSFDVEIWKSIQIRGNKTTTTTDVVISKIGEHVSITKDKEGDDSDKAASHVSPSSRKPRYTGPKKSSNKDAIISGKGVVWSSQSFEMSRSSASSIGPAAPMEAKLDAHSRRVVSTPATSSCQSLLPISEEDEEPPADHAKENEVQEFLESLVTHARRAAKRRGSAQRKSQELRRKGLFEDRGSQHAPQTTFVSFPSIEEHEQLTNGTDAELDDYQQEEFQSEAEFDRQLQQAYSEKSWYPETTVASEVDDNEPKQKSSKARRAVVRHGRAGRILVPAGWYCQSGDSVLHNPSATTQEIDVDGDGDLDFDIDPLTDDSNTPESSRTPTPPNVPSTTDLVGANFVQWEQFDDIELETLLYIQPKSVVGAATSFDLPRSPCFDCELLACILISDATINRSRDSSKDAPKNGPQQRRQNSQQKQPKWYDETRFKVVKVHAHILIFKRLPHLRNQLRAYNEARAKVKPNSTRTSKASKSVDKQYVDVDCAIEGVSKSIRIIVNCMRVNQG
ncbi:hypothetical protein BD289DRAFT_495495 [Coniella lustricola]|uniref:Uncharacterized protein n=1 Tax=Coniella lustricola TaxID=2025994 RepID=A0A2T2ZTT4_9PEZI|nr:hypothetical protein BD289DRAFT_495495 [Coniella lustricola]